MNVAYNMDCMAAMQKIPDHYFDLAVVDPPYGIGIDGQKLSINKNPKHNRKYHPTKGWDAAPPPDEYFRELERVSKHQIIWGANYFVPAINQRHKGWIVWYKGQQDLTMSDIIRHPNQSGDHKSRATAKRGRNNTPNTKTSGAIFLDFFKICKTRRQDIGHTPGERQQPDRGP